MKNLLIYFHNNPLSCFQHSCHFGPFYPGFFISSTLPDPMTNWSPSTYFSWIISSTLMSFILLYTEGLNYLDQGSASCGLQSGFNLLLVLVNENLVKHNHACYFVHGCFYATKAWSNSCNQEHIVVKDENTVWPIITTTKANIWSSL